jgi:DDE superfamily endonuclease
MLKAADRKLNRGDQPDFNNVVVLDNAKWHVLARYQHRDDIEFMDIPPYSPEFNKPVEHAFNCIKAAFWERYNTMLMERAAKPIVFREAKDLLKQVAQELITSDSVQKDVLTMRDTYKAIIENGGSYIAGRFS